MATKKATTTKVIIEGKEYSINEYLPTDILKKDFKWQEYVDVKFIRDIARQLDILERVEFKPVEKLASSNSAVALLQTCVITLKDWRVFEGLGALNLTSKTLLSDGLYGGISRLRARAFKDALKYVAKIFEFPQEEEAIEKTFEEVEKKAEKIVDNTDKDYVADFAEYIATKNPKTVEEFEIVRQQWAKENNLKQLIEKWKVNTEELKKIADEWRKALSDKK